MADPSTATPERTTRLERQLESLRLRLGIPGMAAGIVRNGTLVWSRGFGYADLERKIPATERTPFRLASVTKTFASVLALELAAEGKMKLSDEVILDTVTLPSYAAPAWNVISHTADAPAGDSFRYDHQRFKLLGPLLENASGQDLRRLVEDRMILPLNMLDTAPGEDAGVCSPSPDAFDDYRAARDTRVLLTSAKPYALGPGLKPRSAPDAPSPLSAAAGMISTVRDMARYAAALDDKRLLDDAEKSLAWSPVITSSGQPLPYGLGWYVQNVRGVKAVWHPGYVPDLSSSLFLKVPEKGLTFILLANADALVSPFADDVSSGDVTACAFADDFLRIFAFEEASGRPLPDPDWSLRSGKFTEWIRANARDDYDYEAEARAGGELRAWRRAKK